MNIAEIRKKTKKRKIENSDNTAPAAEAYTDMPVDAPPDDAGPPPALSSSDTSTALESRGGDGHLLDEENLYSKYSKKEDRDLKEFLCFKLGPEEYAIDIATAKEIIKHREVTEVPKTVDFIIGIIAIRGEIVPVFDIKKLLGIDMEQVSLTSKLVILCYAGETVSICVDSITQITKIPLHAIEATPINISGAKHELIKGVVIIDGRMIRILDIEKILNF